MKKKSKKAKPFKAKHILVERLKEGDWVYIRNDIAIEDIGLWCSNNHHFVNVEMATAIKNMPLTFLSADGHNSYVSIGSLSGYVPRKWITRNPDRVDPDQIMPDMREYLDAMHLKLA